LFFVALAFLAIPPCSTNAFEGVDTFKKQADTGTPWNISAQKIIYNHKTDVYTATGDVRVNKDGKTLTGDLIQYNRTTGEALSIGNVMLTAGKDTLQGDEIQINLQTGTGVIRKGKIFIEKNHFFIKGDEILKTGENTYEIKNASLTSCDGERPAWRITGQDLDVTVEEYGWVKNAAFRVKDWPVLYLPYLVFPVKIKRQTGLLAPQVGFSSRNGFELTQPLYWAINQSSDATLYYHHLQERGEKIGGEYRYTLSSQSKGTIMMDSLNERQTDDGAGDWGYSGDPWLRTNSDRYWFRTKMDQALPGDVKAMLDLDIVSDQDYLHEFSDGYTGLDATKKYFNSQFGRDMDDENESVRENALTFSRIWTGYSVNVEMLWYDDVVKRRQESKDDTLQQLPGVTFDAIKHPLFNDRFLAGMNSEYTNFFRQDGDTGQKIDIHPRLYMPLHYQNYITFEPSAGFRQTAWYTDPEALDPTDDTPIYNDYQHRELYDLKADLSTDLFQVFQVRGQSVDKIKHAITPRLEYSYIPEADQSEYPQFTDTDRIDAENLTTFSLTNFLISKRHPPKPEPGDLSKSALKITPDTDPYHQFLRFLVAQSYDFGASDEPGEKPFTPLYAELDIEPARLLTLHADSEYSHDLARFVSHNVNARLTTESGDYLVVEHRYGREDGLSLQADQPTEDIHSLYAGCLKGITQSIHLFGNHERNIETGKSIETVIGCQYQAQCWSFALSYKNEINDRKIGFMIGLSGLADIGSSL